VDPIDPLTAELPGHLIPITTVGNQTGIRVGELQKIHWPQVDFDALLIRSQSGSQPRQGPSDHKKLLGCGLNGDNNRESA
jgi:hypothetical protein